MRVNLFIIISITTATGTYICSMDKPRSTPLPLHPAQTDVLQAERIVNKIRFNIYPKAECREALLLAFKKIRENPMLPHTGWQEEQKADALLLVKEMWQLFTDSDIGNDEASLCYGAQTSRLDGITSSAARNLVEASMKLISQEKSETIHKLRTQRIILCATAGFLLALGIFTNLLTYYGICHK